MSTENQGEGLDYAIHVDTDSMEEDISRGIAQFERLGDAAEREGERIQESMSDIAKMTAAYFSFQALKGFATQIVNVRGEIEALGISFETLLGSKEKADELFSSIKDFAVQTPMTMSALAEGAKTLLGFSIESEKVMPIMKAIGDIAMGDTQKFNSLTLAFAQATSAGKLAGQDFLQMVNAGFNPLNEMAKTTGKSIKQLKQEMEDGSISAKMLEDAFMSATAEGGMFYGMLEKQSHGIKGAISNLQGAWDDMLNDIGSRQQSVFIDGVNLLTDLCKNYEPFLNAILSVAAAYGTYRAALMAVWVVEKARALAENIQLIMMFRKELGLLTAAQQAFNVTAWANPYVLLAAAIIGVCSALYLYSDRASTAEKAQKELNDEKERFSESLANERAEIEECIRIIQDKTETDYSQIAAYERLKKLCPELTEAYKREELAVASLAETSKTLNERDDEKTYDHYVEELKKSTDELEKAKAKWDETLNKQSNKGIITQKILKGKRDDELVPLQEKVNEYKRIIDEMDALRKKAAEEAIPIKQRIETQTEIVSDHKKKLDEAKAELQKAQVEYEKKPTIWNRLIKIKCQWSFDFNKEQLEEEEGKLAALEAQQLPTFAEDYASAQKAYNDAYKKVQQIKKNRSAYTQNEWVKASEDLKEAKKKFENMGGEVKSDTEIKNEAKKRQELMKELELIRKESRIKVEEAELNAMEDGMRKRLRQIEIDRDSQIAAIEKEQADLTKKFAELKMTVPEDVLKTYADRISAVNKSAQSETRRTEEENVKYIAELYRGLSDVFLTEEQQKIAAIKQTYKEQRDQLEKDRKGGTISDADYNSLVGMADKAEAKELEDYFLEAYGDYYQKRQTLQEQWESNLANIPAKYAAEARKKMEAELSSMDIEQFKKNFNWDLMFGDLGNQSIESLRFTLDKVKDKFEEMKSSMTVTEIRDWQEAIVNLENEIANRNPFSALHKSFNDISASKSELVAALQEMNAANEALVQSQNDYNLAIETESALREMVDRGEIAEDDERIVEAEQNLATTRENLNKATERAGQADQAVIRSRNNVTKSYNQFATSLKSAGGVITSIGGKAKNLASVFSDDVAGAMDKSLDFIDEVLDATTNVISSIADVGKSVAKGMETTVDAMGESTKATAAATATSISTVEKASVILTVISAALQIATAIANLFNNDDAKQKEIENLQERIDQLQWELDNADTLRLQRNSADAVQKLAQCYNEAYNEVLRLHGVTKNASQWQRYFTAAINSAQIYGKTIEKLADYWADVNYTADKALGKDKYADSRKQLENLAEQQILIQKQINEEQSKKKTDNGKIQDWKNQISEIAQEMADLINEMLEDIIGYSAQDLSKELSDAFFEAAKNGEDAMEAWGKKVKEITADVMQNMLITKFLEEPIGEIFNQYKKKWFGDDGKFKGIDNVINSMDEFSNDLNRVGTDFNKIWESLPDNVREWFAPEADIYSQEASRGYATEMSEETGSNILGRATAIAEAQEAMKQSTMRIELGVVELSESLRDGLSIVNEIHDMTGIGIAHLEQISKNTSKLHEIAETLDDIKRKTNDL